MLTLNLTQIANVSSVVALGIFGAAAYQDYQNRRVSNKAWVIGILASVIILPLFALEILERQTIIKRIYMIQLVISTLFIPILGLLFYYKQLMGGADAKAFIVLGFLLPLQPEYILLSTEFPLVGEQIGTIFSVSVIANAFLISLLLPIYLGLKNAAGESSLALPTSLFAYQYKTSDIFDAHGKLLLENRKVDLDTIRMYLRWIGEDMSVSEEIPTSVIETHDSNVEDGRVRTDGGDDTVEEFIEKHGRYNDSPEDLRVALESLKTNQIHTVQIGAPLLVFVFLGLITSLIFGGLPSVVVIIL